MAQRAIDWEVAPEGDSSYDPDNLPPIVVPRPRRRRTRHVGIVKLYAPAKSYGLVASEAGDAIFNIDDVEACDRARLDSGQTVTFEVVEGPDGQTARRIRIDATTLPPRPDDGLVSKGWR
jgi:cold shock CspA family protein